MATIDDVEAKLIAFATDLGITKGKLEALDQRVEHNCQRNEDNFAKVNAKIDTLTNNVITAITRGQERDEAVRQEVIREQGANYIKSEEIPQIVDEKIPQQLLVSMYRKFNK